MRRAPSASSTRYPASDGGLEFSTYYTPVDSSAQTPSGARLRLPVLGANKTRVVEPLVIDVFNGASYLVARVKWHRRDQGLPLLSRMTSMPVVLPDALRGRSSDALDIARAWRPEFQRSPTPIDVVVTTNENYADLLVRQYPGALAAHEEGRAGRGGHHVSTVRAPRCASCSKARNGCDCSSPKSLKAELKSG